MAAMMATIAGRPRARHRAYTRAATRMAMRMPIMPAAFPAPSRVNRRERRRSALPREQRVAVEHGHRHVDDAAVRGAGLLAQALERLALVNAVALHQDALRALDHRPALQRRLELVDLLGEPLRLAVAAHRDLDGALHLVRLRGRDVGGDAALGGARHEVHVGLAAQLRQNGPARELDRLRD